MPPEQLDLVVEIDKTPPPVAKDDFSIEVEIADAPKVERARDESGKFARRNEDDSELAQLRKQLADADADRTRLRTETAQLRNHANELNGRVQSASDQAAEAEYATLQTRIANAGERQKTLREKLAVLNSVGDYEGAADVQVELTKLAVAESNDKAQANHLKLRYQESKRVPAKVPGDSFEDALKNLTGPTQDWLRKHPECINDRKMNIKVQAAHLDAIDEGLREDSPQYFAFVEEKLGFRKPAEREDDDYDTRPKKAHQPAREESRHMSPPVHREGGNQSSQRATRITLTADEREMARLNDMTDEEYARNKMRMLNEGQNFHAKFGRR